MGSTRCSTGTTSSRASRPTGTGWCSADSSSPDGAMPGGPAPPRGGPAFRRLLRAPMGALGVALVALVVSGAVLAGGLTGRDPTALDLPARHQGPSWTHPLGTDHLGRDLFARVLYGGQVALKVSGVSVSLALAVGLLLRMLAGYGPPWL